MNGWVDVGGWGVGVIGVVVWTALTSYYKYPKSEEMSVSIAGMPKVH